MSVDMQSIRNSNSEQPLRNGQAVLMATLTVRFTRYLFKFSRHIAAILNLSLRNLRINYVRNFRALYYCFCCVFSKSEEHISDNTFC